jgi:STE24 endopeptidase
MENLFSYYTQVIFLCLIVTNHLFEIYLYRRQLTTLHENQSTVPEEFKKIIPLDDHQKAIQYATAKLQLGQWKLMWEAVLLFYWFPFRGLEKLYLATPFIDLNKEMAFLILFILIQTLINLPWSIYSTFFLEEKFGFNRTTPKLFIADRLKGMILGFLIGVPLLYCMLLIYNSTGKYWWMIAFGLMTIFQFLLIWIYPTFIAPLFNKFNPLSSDELKKGIGQLVQNAGFNAKEVFVMDASRRSSHGNAYFTGLGKNKRVVFFDTLLNDLSHKEIFAILAHELGHMKLKHIPKSIMISLILSFVGFWLMGEVSTKNWFYSGHFVRAISPGMLFLIFMQAIPMYSFWLTPIGSWISRRKEFEADEYAANETNPEDLISGLLKLYQQNASPVVTDRFYSNFYHSHPPAFERVARLRSFIKSKPSEGVS